MGKIDNYPRITEPEEGDTVTLGQLRELVDAAALLPPNTVVRAHLVPFKMADLGNAKGGSVKSIALDRPS